MIDQPELDYTINDPSSVECPHCHEKMDLSLELLAGMIEYELCCPRCEQTVILQIGQEITVVARKPEKT